MMKINSVSMRCINNASFEAIKDERGIQIVEITSSKADDENNKRTIKDNYEHCTGVTNDDDDSLNSLDDG